MKPLPECQLYGFVDMAYLLGRKPEMVVQQLCDGGADLIQLRAKTSTPEEIRRLAETVLPITRKAEVGLVVNDHPAIAQESGAELCHLGQEDFFDAGHTNVSSIRPPGSTLQIGLSTHAPEQARRAIAAAADYVAIGPVFPTATKPGAKAVTLGYVRWAASNVAIPWFVIGGINLENLDQVLAAGARRVCVVSAILNSDDVTRACRQFKQRLEELRR
jgi:thiamine-phosphate pyrophosphorylase